MAAAVAAAAHDSEEEQQWQQQWLEQEHTDQLPVLRNKSWAGNTLRATSTSKSFAWRQNSTPAHRSTVPGGFAVAGADPSTLRLGSTVTSAAVEVAKADALQHAYSAKTAEGHPVRSATGYDYSTAGSRAPGMDAPCPSISGAGAVSLRLISAGVT